MSGSDLDSPDEAELVTAAERDRAAAGEVDDLEASGAPTFEEAHFRQVLGHFATGITVITTIDDAGPVGFTCQSFMSLSMDPPLVVFSPSRSSSTWPRIEKTEKFCVNILSERQEDICRVFATKSQDKFAGVGWRAGRTGAPILHDVLGWIEARIDAVHDGGDHLLVAGRVIDLGMGEPGHPLLFYRGGYGRFEA